MSLLELLVAVFGGAYRRPVNPARPVIQYTSH
jgi:hypothetical protein